MIVSFRSWMGKGDSAERFSSRFGLCSLCFAASNRRLEPLELLERFEQAAGQLSVSEQRFFETARCNAPPRPALNSFLRRNAARAGPSTPTTSGSGTDRGPHPP